MANPEHVEILKQGVEVWNAWRKENPSVIPDLSEANLSGATLNEANLTRTDFTKANLTQANLMEAALWEAKLVDAEVSGANFTRANLNAANFSGAYLDDTVLYHASMVLTDLYQTDLSRADMRKADLTCANLTEAYLEDSNISDCHVHGIVAWDAELNNVSQFNLIVTHDDEPEISVDNLAIAQFIYLVLKNVEIRNVIDPITAKAVLILGRFTEQSRAVLDSLRTELRKRGYLPILFNFEIRWGRNLYNLTETVQLLAQMSRFVIADLTDATSIPLELRAIAPNLPSVVVQPILLRSDNDHVTSEAMSDHFKPYPWVLATYAYEDTEQSLVTMAEDVIELAEAKVKELRSGTT